MSSLFLVAAIQAPSALDIRRTGMSSYPFAASTSYTRFDRKREAKSWPAAFLTHSRERLNVT